MKLSGSSSIKITNFKSVIEQEFGGKLEIKDQGTIR